DAQRYRGIAAARGARPGAPRTHEGIAGGAGGMAANDHRLQDRTRRRGAPHQRRAPPARQTRADRPLKRETEMAGNAEKIIELDKKRMNAMAQKDIATLNDVLADDLVYTHSSARLDTKASLIDNMRSGATVYSSVVPSDVKAQDCGDTVVLTGVARISVNSGGNAMNFGVRFTDVYANRGGRWQMVAWQSTRLAE